RSSRCGLVGLLESLAQRFHVTDQTFDIGPEPAQVGVAVTDGQLDCPRDGFVHARVEKAQAVARVVRGGVEALRRRDLRLQGLGRLGVGRRRTIEGRELAPRAGRVELRTRVGQYLTLPRDAPALGDGVV